MCVIMVGEGLCFNLNKELGNLIVYPTLEYLISVPHLLSVPADKFPKIPVRLLDP